MWGYYLQFNGLQESSRTIWQQPSLILLAASIQAHRNLNSWYRDKFPTADADSDMDLESPREKKSKRPRKDEAPKFKAPVGVTVIEDDEDLVQLGMQKAMRRPRQAPMSYIPVLWSKDYFF